MKDFSLLVVLFTTWFSTSSVAPFIILVSPNEAFETANNLWKKVPIKIVIIKIGNTNFICLRYICDQVLTVNSRLLWRRHWEMFILLTTRHHLRYSRATFRRCRSLNWTDIRERSVQHSFVNLGVALIDSYGTSGFPVSLHFTLLLQTVGKTVLSIHR